jgi:hypothetical protein
VSRRIAAVCGLLLAFLLQPAQAQEGRKFAVLSLIGDRFLVVQHVSETGNRLGRDRRSGIALPERAFDNAMAADVEQAIRDVAPGAAVVKLGGSRVLYPADGEDQPDALPLLAKVKPAIAPAGVTHLVVLTKLQHEARMPMLNTIQGSGKLEGVGFYMDHNLPTEDRESDQAGRGYLAPFAYFRVSLVDVANESVIGYHDVVAAAPVTAGRSPSLQVWESLSSGEKVQLVHQLAKKGMREAVEKLLGKT